MTFKSSMCAVIGAATLAASAAFSSGAFAGEFGTADEAKAMLTKAAAAVKADKAKALAEFTKGEGGFKDRDLYPFCGGPDGLFTAHPTLAGKSLKDLKDKTGKALDDVLVEPELHVVSTYQGARVPVRAYRPAGDLATRPGRMGLAARSAGGSG